MNEIRKKIDKLRKLLKNDQKRKNIILAMYAAVFILVLIAILVGTTPSYELNERLEKFKTYDNYNYNYTVTMTKDLTPSTVSISGKRYKEKHQLISDQNVYNYETGKLLFSPIKEINLAKLEYSDLYELIYMSELKKSDNFKDEYELDVNRFVKYMNNIKTNSNKTILINVIYINDEVAQIELDLTNYVNLNKVLFKQYTVAVAYNNIGNVVDF